MSAVQPIETPANGAVAELTFCIANWNMRAHLQLPFHIELEPAARAYLPERR